MELPYFCTDGVPSDPEDIELASWRETFAGDDQGAPPPPGAPPPHDQEDPARPPADEVANTPPPQARGPQLCKLHDKFVWQAQCNEGIMQRKSESMDAISILAGFLTAFMLSVVLELDMTSFNSKALFHVFAAFSSISVAAGLSAILVMTAVSAKLHRLLGRSQVYYGTDTSADHAASIRAHGCQYHRCESWDVEEYFTYWLDPENRKYACGKKVGPAELFASHWYSSGNDKSPTKSTGSSAPQNPVNVLYRGFRAFQILIFCVVGATVAKCLDALGGGISGLIVGSCHGAILIIPTFYTWHVLKRCAALNDLF